MAAAAISTSPQLRRIARALTSLALVAGLAFALLMLVPAALGLQRIVIIGGSMSGSYDRGSVVFASKTRPAELHPGDVITFVPPGRYAAKGRVTHRIASVDRDRTGTRVFGTKGDVNGSLDPWRFRVTGDGVPRAVFHVPYAGYVFQALSVRPIRMAVIGLPALVIALTLLASLWRDAGEEARHQEAARQPEAATQ